MNKIAATALVWFFALAAPATPVLPAKRIVGRIVQVRTAGTVLLAHAAEADMPAMTMEFRVDRPNVATLRPGMEISALADGRTAPPLLRSIRIVARAAQAQRYVPTLQEGDTIPAFRLIDQHGRPFALSDYRGRALALAFIYTRCSDRAMCPLLSAKFAQLQHRIVGEPIHLLEVTLDPAYDTPPVLARYAKAFAADERQWTFATGDAAISDLAARAGIVTTETPRGIAHSEAVILLNREGRVWKTIDGNAWTPDELLTEIRASLGATTDPFLRFRLWLESGVAAICGGPSGVSTAGALGIFFAVLLTAAAVVRKLFYSGTLRR